MDTNGKVAIVTGGGSGVGRRSALALADAGYSVAVAGRRAEMLEQTRAEAGQAASRVLPVPTDIANRDAVRALFARTVESFGRLDLLFNNAGTGAPAIPIEELPYDDWKRVVDVNLTGSFPVHAGGGQDHEEPTDRWADASSTTAPSPHTRPGPTRWPIPSTKHAITGLTKSTSLDGRRYGIACGQIDIGNADTPMTARMHRGVLQPDGTTATEPTFDADHVARAVVHMAGLPPDTNILFMTIMANGMPFVGRG